MKLFDQMNGGRRQALKLALGAGGLALASPVSRVVAAVCGKTPAQVEGPFYPVKRQPDEDTDLTRVAGRGGGASGQLIYIGGEVTDLDCRPVQGAIVEIWQACATGRYNHPGDTNPAALDPNFQYWGRAVTNNDGRYEFKTILPGAYPAGDGWIRPPHIHYKVHKRGYMELTTQMYFEGNQYNATDLILQRLPRDEQRKVIVPMQGPRPHQEQNAKYCEFDVVIERLA